MNQIDAAQLDTFEKQYRINLINSLLGYRSLNLLGTVNSQGETNLCPVSSAFHLGANPSLLGLVMRPQRAHNDSLPNIKETEQFTLNNVLPKWYKQAHQSSASYPKGVSEFEACGFTASYIKDFKAPFVKESTVKIGLQLREVLPMSLNNTTIIIGEIIHILAHDGIIQSDGVLDHAAAETVTVSGLDAYFLPQLLGRLAYAKPDREPRNI